MLTIHKNIKVIGYLYGNYHYFSAMMITNQVMNMLLTLEIIFRNQKHLLQYQWTMNMPELRLMRKVTMM